MDTERYVSIEAARTCPWTGGLESLDYSASDG